MNYPRFSGIYPHLAVTNDEHSECGIGAVVNYGGRLYWITYPAARPTGSTDKLYSIDESLDLVVHPESVGGTDANRMIHPKTGKLILGAYVIDKDGTIKAYDVKKLEGRLTGAALSLNDPDEWVYINTMEDGFYEVNVNTMAIRRLRRDLCNDSGLHTVKEKLFGNHGKGCYSAQGVCMFSNNGHLGILAEWDGKGDAQKKANWKVIDRNKYTEITGPGGINGPTSSTDPVWALGWDDKSVLLNVRESGRWTRYRLPKASYTQDADHGWYTEWPRIRQIGPDHYLMCMHGMFYDFPGQFTPLQKNGIRPICRHLKMIADWDNFGDELAFACDDASPFDNPLLGQQSSNLWFAKYEDLEAMSEPLGFGGVWSHENVICNEPSEAFFVGGFDLKTLHIYNGDMLRVTFRIECDKHGWEAWTPVQSIEIHGYSYVQIPLDLPEGTEWVRIVPERDATGVSAFFHLRMKNDVAVDESLLKGLHKADKPGDFCAGKLYPLEGLDMRMQYYLTNPDGSIRTYEIGGDMKLKAVPTPDPMPDVDAEVFFDPIVRDTGHSFVLIDCFGNKFHVAKGNPVFDQLDAARITREVVTERSMMYLGGTFYEVPRPASDGLFKIKPVATPNVRITDFCSWRGLLVLTGVDAKEDSEHIVRADDGTGLWFGNVDDLWRMGTPSGVGGPIDGGFLYRNEQSEPFLLMGYRHVSLKLSHDQKEPVSFMIDVDFEGGGTYGCWKTFTVEPGEGQTFEFPEGFAAHWVKIRPSADCHCSAIFTLN